MKTGRNKRRFAAISLSLGMLAALGGFTACAEKDEAQGAQIKATFSFDTFEELHGVKTKNFQGKLSLGTGEGMFTEGKASMKLSVAKPATYIYHRYSERKDFLTPIFSLPIGETDLAATAAFTMDVFNANAYDSGVYLFAKNVGGEVIYSAYGAARANEWNKLSFPVNQAFVSEKITEIYVSVADTNENTVYYFDNFVCGAERADFGALFGQRDFRAFLGGRIARFECVYENAFSRVSRRACKRSRGRIAYGGFFSTRKLRRRGKFRELLERRPVVRLYAFGRGDRGG